MLSEEQIQQRIDSPQLRALLNSIEAGCQIRGCRQSSVWAVTVFCAAELDSYEQLLCQEHRDTLCERAIPRWNEITGHEHVIAKELHVRPT